MSPGRLRIRALLDRQSAVVVLVLLIAGAAGGVLAYDAYAQPNTTTVTEEVTVWAPEGEFTHGATVVENETRTAGIFAPGERVENRGFYYRSIMPVLSGEFRYGYAADSGELDVTVERTLVVRSVGERAGRSVEYWRETESLGTDRATLAPGETVAVPYRANVTAAAVRAERIRERLGDPGETRVSVNVSVGVAGTAGGRDVDRTIEYGLPLTVDGPVYRVESASDVPPVTRTERRTAARDPGPLPAVGGPALLAVSLAGLGALAYARRENRLALSAAERAWLDYRDDRADYDEWISTVRLPEEARALPVGYTDTLVDLVDVAIDTDSAVFESPEGDRYHVLHDGYRYTFEAPPDPRGVDPGAAVTAEPDGQTAAAGHGGDGPADDAGEPTRGRPDDADVPAHEADGRAE
jgi:hypothetical protein